MLPVKFYTPGIILYMPTVYLKIQVAGCLFSLRPWDAPVVPYTCRYVLSPPFQPRRETVAWIHFFLPFPFWLIKAGHGGDYSLDIRGLVGEEWKPDLSDYFWIINRNGFFETRCSIFSFIELDEKVGAGRRVMYAFKKLYFTCTALIKNCFLVSFGKECRSN